MTVDQFGGSNDPVFELSIETDEACTSTAFTKEAFVGTYQVDGSKIFHVRLVVQKHWSSLKDQRSCSISRHAASVIL